MAGGFLRYIAAPLTPIYYSLVALRNAYYDKKGASYTAKFPVIAVGNISLGGTGKTPLCLHIYEILKRQNKKIAIVLRGYRGGDHSDEAKLYSNRCGSENVFTGADRRISLAKVGQKNFEVAILDDAYQHRKVFRDLNILLIDGTRLPDEDSLLPLGNLREPLSGLKRANSIVLSRYEQANAKKVDVFVQWLNRQYPKVGVYTSRQKMKTCRSFDGRKVDVANEKFFMVCGIGHPHNFLAFCHLQKFSIVGHSFLADHHDYDKKDFLRVSKEAEEKGATAFLITSKDAVKWSAELKLPTGVVEIENELNSYAAKQSFEEMVIRALN